jgi:intraflagellar transport protein 81
MFLVENKKGVTGYRDMNKNIEGLSTSKSKIDEQKGKTLEEISAIVQELTTKIGAEKEQLQPQVIKLKKTRQQFQDMDQEYSEKKAIYENTKVGYESERTKLVQEIDILQAELSTQERVYHTFSTANSVLDVTKKRVEDETKYKQGQGKYNEEYKTYCDMLTARITRLEQEGKELLENQRFIKENHEPSLKQITWFTSLKKLLESKSHQQKNPGDGFYKSDVPNAMNMMNVNGSDRLVLGGN